MNILESISFSHHLFQLFNLSQLRIDKIAWSTLRSRFLEIYSFIVSVVSIVMLLYGIFISNLNGTTLGDIGVTVDFIQLIAIRTGHIVCIIEALSHRNEQQILIKNIQEIDRIFEISLNIDVENSKFRSKITKNGLSMLVLYFFSEIFIFLVTALDNNSDFIYFWLFYLLPLLACGMRYFQFILFIDILKLRFGKLAKVIENVNLLFTNKSEVQKCKPTTMKLMKKMDKLNKNAIMYRDGFDLSKLLVIRDLYSRLWEISVLVNKCFGLSMLIAIGVDFMAITANFYWIFLNFKQYSTSFADFLKIISSVFWSVPHVFNILTVAIMCHTTIETTSEIALSVHRIQIDLFNENHNSLIEQFSLQLLHQKIHFTAFGFFSIDCSLIYTIVGATTTYLIILIQFHLNERKEEAVLHTQAVISNSTL